MEAMGDVLVGSDRPFVITSGTGLGNMVPGEPATEDVVKEMSLTRCR